MLDQDTLRAALGRMAEREKDDYEMFSNVEIHYEETKKMHEAERAKKLYEEMTGHKIADKNYWETIPLPKDIVVDQQEIKEQNLTEVKQKDKEKEETKDDEWVYDEKENSEGHDWAGESKEFWLSKRAQLKTKYQTASASEPSSSNSKKVDEGENIGELKQRLSQMETEMGDMKEKFFKLETLLAEVISSREEERRKFKERKGERRKEHIKKKIKRLNEKLIKFEGGHVPHVEEDSCKHNVNTMQNHNVNVPKSDPTVVGVTQHIKPQPPNDEEDFGFSIVQHGISEENEKDHFENLLKAVSLPGSDIWNIPEEDSGDEGTTTTVGGYFKTKPFEEVPPEEFRVSAIDHVNKRLLESFRTHIDGQEPRQHEGEEKESYFTDKDWED